MPTATCTRENSRTVSHMAEACYGRPMQHTKASGRTVRSTERASASIPTAMSMKENGRRVRSTERVTTSGRAKRSDEDEGRIVDVPFWFCNPPICRWKQHYR
jgi:hypothetical protein